MCRKYHRLGGVWNLVELFHKNGTFGLQGLNDVPVVDDLVAHIDRRSELGQSQLDDLDGAVHARAEAAGRGKENLEGAALRTSWLGIGRGQKTGSFGSVRR